MDRNEEKFSVRDLRRKEKFFVDDLYLNGYAKKCGIYATGVYLSLCRHANKEQSCYPSYKKISEELKISVKQVGRTIKILEKNGLIKKIRCGKKLNNRYLLLDKSEWTDSPFTRDYQSNHIWTDSPIHSKDTQFKDTNKKEISFKELAGAYKKGDRKYKPYFWKSPMRWVAEKQKWFVIKDGDWLDFTGKESDIDWLP